MRQNHTPSVVYERAKRLLVEGKPLLPGGRINVEFFDIMYKTTTTYITVAGHVAILLGRAPNS